MTAIILQSIPHLFNHRKAGTKFSRTYILVRYFFGMGKMNIVVSDELERRFRKEVGYYMGLKKGNIKKALEEALELWIDRTERTHHKTPGKTEIGWS